MTGGSVAAGSPDVSGPFLEEAQMLGRLWTLMMVLAVVLAACNGDTTDDVALDEAPDTEVEAADEEPVATAECGPDHPGLHESGQLTVATGETVFPPWMMDDDPAGGEGFENGVVYALAEELGFARDDVVWTSSGFDEAIAAGPKPYDFNIQQYSITEERREVVDFSVPYYVEEKVLVTFPDSPGANAESLDDLVDLKYGAMIGTTDLDYIENVIGAADVDVFDELADVFLAMEGGQIEATVVGLPTALFATAVQVPDAIIAGILPGSEGEEGLGLLVPKGSEFLPCLDEGLEALRADGTLDALADEWLAGGGEIPTISG
jgi:polar amino acid transport system substrate-binding protein